jgi:hypothetical protein
MLAANLVLGWITLLILRRYARSKRQQVGKPRPVASVDTASTPSTG